MDASATGIIQLRSDLRVVNGHRYWILEVLAGKKWKQTSFCGTKQGLLLAIRDWLLEHRLREEGAWFPKEMMVFNANLGRDVRRTVVTKDQLLATEIARKEIREIGPVGFGVSPDDWAQVESMPEFFSRAAPEGAEAAEAT